jgi:hypothetical protein
MQAGVVECGYNATQVSIAQLTVTKVNLAQRLRATRKIFNQWGPIVKIQIVQLEQLQ